VAAGGTYPTSCDESPWEQILDYGIDRGTPYIVMELLEGESLAQCLTRLGRLTARDTAHVLSQVAQGLTRAHGKGIVHRDLKPENNIHCL